ncbi:hypothetical protein JFU03_15990 [Bacillus sp. TH44]|uniref:hypothetical protein n=1 Tax=unclassified Bacillus (in: firmicutes) TaxID=185979 RepID=UPI001914121F|nr:MULTISPECIES: hypothetical protein [unclassified Bacillus (in: firmicutes)]MBK5346992.1 hypothetical protein [Bacillus sp. TH45]MBK5359511.1 hypothetical protein [Bacillus sp. TH44]MBK5366106.1 hypothetical protein [Bacillus sp. TH50]
MCKNIFVIAFIVLMISLNLEKAYASERVVFLSIPSKVWHQNIYLIAEKKLDGL